MRKLLLFLSDIAVLYSSLVFALVIRYGLDARAQWDSHLVPFSAVFVIWLLAMYIANLYDRRALRNRREFFQALVQASAAATVLSIMFFYAVPSVGIAPKTNLLIFAGVFILFQAGARYLHNTVLEHGGRRNALIIDAGPESLELAAVIRDNPQLGWRVAGIAHLAPELLPLDGAASFTALYGMDELERALQSGRVDTAVIGPGAYAMPPVVDRLFGALHRGVEYTDLATFSERLTGKVPVTAISRVWFLENLSEGSKQAYEAAKRITDIIISVAAGIPVLVLFPFIALAVKLDSSGPVLFSQQRSGKGGRTFSIVKFRSMRSDAEKFTGAVWAAENDPRITRVGRILRKSRVDELPQLWNILRGHMSLVGPRAERPEFEQRLAVEIPFYRQRYLVKPGLSGWAQIKYSYGASVRDALEKLQYDLYYIKHRSLLLDLEIILKTLAISLRQQGR